MSHHNVHMNNIKNLLVLYRRVDTVRGRSLITDLEGTLSFGQDFHGAFSMNRAIHVQHNSDDP
jgi:hypothetical protein